MEQIKGEDKKTSKGYCHRSDQTVCTKKKPGGLYAQP